MAQVKVEFNKILDSLGQYEQLESEIKDNQKPYYKTLVVGISIFLVSLFVFVSYKVFHEIETKQKLGNEQLSETPEKLKEKQDKSMDLGSARIPIEDAIKRDNQIEKRSEKKVDLVPSLEKKRNKAISKITHEFKLSDPGFRGADCPLPIRLFKKFSRAPKLYKLFLKGSNARRYRQGIYNPVQGVDGS